MRPRARCDEILALIDAALGPADVDPVEQRTTTLALCRVEEPPGPPPIARPRHLER